MRHPIHYRGGVRGYGRGVKEALDVSGVLVFQMPSRGSPSVVVFEDNKGAIDVAKNILSSSNSKHIDVRYHFLRELVGTGDLSVKYLRTEDQHADIVTKAIGKESFEKHRDFLLEIQIFVVRHWCLFELSRLVS